MLRFIVSTMAAALSARRVSLRNIARTTAIIRAAGTPLPLTSPMQKNMEAVEGKKKKEKVDHEETFALAEINSVTPYIDFK